MKKKVIFLLFIIDPGLFSENYLCQSVLTLAAIRQTHYLCLGDDGFGAKRMSEPYFPPEESDYLIYLKNQKTLFPKKQGSNTISIKSMKISWFLFQEESTQWK